MPDQTFSATKFYCLKAGAVVGLLLASALNSLPGPIVCSRVADLNPGAVGSFPTNLTVCAGSLFFSAYTLSTGWEPWRYHGNTITLVSNINDTADDIGSGILEGNDSSPGGFTSFATAVYFSAFDPRRGGELWRFDGTNAFRVTDINPDASDTIKSNPASAWPSELTVLGNVLFFSADSGGLRPNYELWKYDGASPTQVANIRPDSGSEHSSFPKGLTVFKNRLYFMANDGVNGYELWTSTGTGATLLTNINASGDSFPKYFTSFANKLFFQAFTDASGYELWQTDGTNTSMVAELNPGYASSFPESLIVYDNALYFSADDGTNGFELWSYDGLALNLVSNINLAGSSSPKNLTVFQNQLYFSANDGIHGWELWKYDGTSASLVTDLDPTGDSFPEQLTVGNGALYFVATTPDSGYELWRYDGNSANLVNDINPGPGSSYPQWLTALNERLCFSAAEDGFSNWEPWVAEPARVSFKTIKRLGADIELTWIATAGRTNIVQSSATGMEGTFTNLSAPIIIPGTGQVVTNFVDVGAAHAASTRFYRILQP
ncbi:MAG TPA: hypothetical protein VFZ59_24835 [Verrucomicrobiae bacterium]|nr:hypothetical protein [Verrucomicrobiae bacterium]